MKILKAGLRVWITLASVLSFVGGWILLVHAPKPYQSTRTAADPQIEALPTLPPLSNFSSGNTFQNQQPQFQQQPFFSRQPAFRTGGS